MAKIAGEYRESDTGGMGDFRCEAGNTGAWQDVVGQPHQVGFVAIIKNCLPNNFHAKGILKYNLTNNGCVGRLPCVVYGKNLSRQVWITNPLSSSASHKDKCVRPKW